MPADRAMIKLHDNYCEMLFVKSLSVIVQVWDEEPCRWKNRNFCKFGDKFNFPFSYLTSSSADPSFHLALPAEMRRKEGERRERERERCSNSSSNTTLGLPFPPTSHSQFWIIFSSCSASRQTKFQDKASTCFGWDHWTGLQDWQRPVECAPGLL